MKKNNNKKNQKRFIVIGVLALSALLLFPSSKNNKLVVKYPSTNEINQFFLNGDYEENLNQGLIVKGQVRERLNQAHHNLTGHDLPEKLIQ
jgi:hypothetical protein